VGERLSHHETPISMNLPNGVVARTSTIPHADHASSSVLVEHAEYAQELVAVIDHPSMKIRYLNPAGRQLLGFAATADLSSLDWTDCLPTRTVPTLLYEIIPALQHGGMWRGESSLWLREVAVERPVEMWVIGSSPDAEGRSALLFSATDHTERRNLTESLAYEQQLIRSLLDSVPDNIYFKDVNSRFIRVSKNMATWMGLSGPADIEGKTDFDFFATEHAQRAFDDEQRIILTRKALINVEEKEVWPDGHVTWVSTSKMPLLAKDGSIMGTFGISRDITARKEAELKLAVTQKELLEASRLAGMAEIASGVLHNIGNALNSVNTSVSLLAEQVGKSRLGNLAKATQMIEQNQANLTEFLANDTRGKQLPGYLIQLSGVLSAEREAFQKEIELLRRNLEHIKEIVAMQQNYASVSHITEDARPEELIDEALRISEASLSRHGISVKKIFDPVPLVNVSRHKVLQILVNLIRNAKHAMDDTGRSDKDMTITLRLSPEGRVQFIVTDNGVGIPKENLAKIYTFGFTTRKNGHGFGLHSSANTAKELGGSLHTASDGPGKGATFTLELPASKSAAR